MAFTDTDSSFHESSREQNGVQIAGDQSSCVTMIRNESDEPRVVTAEAAADLAGRVEARD
jgi:hypothetical protein